MKADTINKSDQWKLNGDCSLCRRKNYCSKPCTACKVSSRQIVSNLVASKIDEMTGGAYREILDRSEY